MNPKSSLPRQAKLAILLLAAGISAIHFSQSVASQSPRAEQRPAVIRLGERLFRDDRFSTPKGDLPASCSHCHLLNEDPQGPRAYADFFNRSWVSSRSADPRRLELRNSPTIFDVGEMPRLHFDGEFDSLEALVKGTFAGRPMGWLPGEQAQAFDRIRAVLLADKAEGRDAGVSYREQFKNTFGADLDKLPRDEAINLVAKAVAEYCRTLTTRKDSPYDRFLAWNGLEPRPAAGESSSVFAQALLAKINSLESERAIRLNAEFTPVALQGLKIFFDARTGNCATCHTPPLFTDHSFHNIGISQREYDQIHGEGAFLRLAIPNAAEARRPSPQFREIPTIHQADEADLGHWNFVDLKTSPLRRAGESDDQFLRRTIATFKTPSLRNLKYSQPYFHDGSAHTLEDVLTEMIQLGQMAREGKVRAADDALAKVNITPADIAPLVAFLNSLNEDLKKGH